MCNCTRHEVFKNDARVNSDRLSRLTFFCNSRLEASKVAGARYSRP